MYDVKNYAFLIPSVGFSSYTVECQSEYFSAYSFLMLIKMIFKKPGAEDLQRVSSTTYPQINTHPKKPVKGSFLLHKQVQIAVNAFKA